MNNHQHRPFAPNKFCDVCGESENDQNHAVLTDIDLVIESLAANGEREEAERLKKATSNVQSVSTHPWSQSFSAFAISNAILDIIDEGHLDNGHRWSWKFDYPDESRADSERLDFRDAVLNLLTKRLETK